MTVGLRAVILGRCFSIHLKARNPIDMNSAWIATVAAIRQAATLNWTSMGSTQFSRRPFKRPSSSLGQSVTGLSPIFKFSNNSLSHDEDDPERNTGTTINDGLLPHRVSCMLTLMSAIGT